MKFEKVSNDTKNKVIDYQMAIVYKTNLLIIFAEKIVEFIRHYLELLSDFENEIVSPQKIIYRKQKAKLLKISLFKRELGKYRSNIFPLEIVEELISYIKFVKYCFDEIKNKESLLKNYREKLNSYFVEKEFESFVAEFIILISEFKSFKNTVFLEVIDTNTKRIERIQKENEEKARLIEEIKKLERTEKRTSAFDKIAQIQLKEKKGKSDA